MDLTLKERIRGSLLGLAACDALGTTLEFKQPGTFEPISDIVGGGPFNLEPGQWTDDTSMALCLAESLVECQGFDPRDQLRRYTRWYREGHLSSTGEFFDIGNATRSALTRFEESGEAYCGTRDPYSAGNGSIMRLAPVPLFFRGSPQVALDRAAESSRTTHGAVTCIDACRYMAGLILGALAEAEKGELLSARFAPVENYWDMHPLCAPIAEVAAGSFRELQPPDIQGSGYVVKSLEAALWAFHNTDSFDEGALLAVNLGDDADTTGAVYGQIAGAYYGEPGIPACWLDKLAMRSEIEHLADGLAAAG